MTHFNRQFNDELNRRFAIKWKRDEAHSKYRVVYFFLFIITAAHTRALRAAAIAMQYKKKNNLNGSKYNNFY